MYMHDYSYIAVYKEKGIIRRFLGRMIFVKK